MLQHPENTNCILCYNTFLETKYKLYATMNPHIRRPNSHPEVAHSQQPFRSFDSADVLTGPHDRQKFLKRSL